MMLHYKACIFGVFLFVCLSMAQQQQQPQQNGSIATTVPQAAAACNFTSVKPTPQTKTYILETCIVAKYAAYLLVDEGKYIELNDGTVNFNKSQCGNQTDQTNPKLTVTFPCGEVQFEITRNNSKVRINSINGYYKIDSSPELLAFKNSTPLFETSGENHYYKCNAEQSILVNNPAAATNVSHLVLSNFAYEAYRTATGTDFYQIPEECALDMGQVSDLVRIGVGICLVALVVIVLIAYFVGRRRWSERSSYESV